MMTSRQSAKPAEKNDERREAIRTLYLESLQLVERLHRRLLDVIKDEFDRNGRSDINSIQALLLSRLDSTVDRDLAQEIEELRLIAAGNDPETGDPFGGGPTDRPNVPGAGPGTRSDGGPGTGPEPKPKTEPETEPCETDDARSHRQCEPILPHG